MSVVPAICTVPLFGILALTITLRELYTPLYIPVTCVITKKTLGKPVLTKDGSVRTEIVTETRCINENAFDVHVRSPHDDELYLLTRQGADMNMSRSGTVHTDAFAIKRRGEATLTSHSNISLSSAHLKDLAAAEEVQMLTHISSKAYLRMNLVVANLNTPWFESESWCGFSIDTKVYPPRQGSKVCFQTREELIRSIPSVDAPSSAPIQMAMNRDRMAMFGVVRDVAAAIIVAVTLLGSALLFWRSWGRYCMRVAAEPTNLGKLEDDDTKPERDAQECVSVEATKSEQV